MLPIKTIKSFCLFCNICFLWKIFYAGGLIKKRSWDYFNTIDKHLTFYERGLLGNYNGETYLKQYKSNLIKGNISAMVNTNPESALYNLDVIQKDDRFKNTLTPKELETLKTEAKTRKEAIDKWNKTKEMAEHFTKTNLIFNQIQTGELTNYDDIVNALIDSNTDEYTSRYLLKQAGYSGELPPDLKEHIEELKIIEKETNRNILNNLNNNINNRKGNSKQ